MSSLIMMHPIQGSFSNTRFFLQYKVLSPVLILANTRVTYASFYSADIPSGISSL
ncbi:hypothetical protein AXFE_30860 [Acidithrix ferrooxidans]|uniref:Uncharacterized protein n=1 Tax=Acidithrix ferrooxidans TaxID=1280514 RepID=A0A0D8HDM7_9ACTN|nr:hypothetical protein AXFE_30860 [Acidithrix ferrooxidans]